MGTGPSHGPAALPQAPFVPRLLRWKKPHSSAHTLRAVPISNEPEELWCCQWDVRVGRRRRGTCPWSPLVSQGGQAGWWLQPLHNLTTGNKG